MYFIHVLVALSEIYFILLPATPEEMKNVFHHVNVEEAQAKYEEDRILVLDLAAKVQTKKYGKGYAPINKMAKQSLGNVLSYAEL